MLCIRYAISVNEGLLMTSLVGEVLKFEREVERD